LAREILIAAIDQVIAGGFPDGRMRVPYSTHVWMARAA
jgi:hypothetical protein